ncbi:MAG: hypothetical protein LH624_07515 [Cryobacterium sp.]|nr:hypothetical protein [Cryobacterium sp.]
MDAPAKKPRPGLRESIEMAANAAEQAAEFRETAAGIASPAGGATAGTPGNWQPSKVTPLRVDPTGPTKVMLD